MINNIDPSLIDPITGMTPDGINTKELFLIASWKKTVAATLLTTAIWVIATYLTTPTDDDTLINFYNKIKPGGKGWNAVIENARAQNITIERSSTNISAQLLSFVVGTITVYAALFATGNWIYGDSFPAIICTLLAIGGSVFLFYTWNKLMKD